jgi:hypothetical protein
LALRKGANLAGKKKGITKEQAINLLRASGWKVDVDEIGKRIALQDPSPDVN